MSNKISLQALALAGIIAVSGLPALAADMTPATPAPGAAVHSDAKSSVSGAGNSAAIGTSTKADAKVIPSDKKASKDLHKDTKATKVIGKDVKDSKDKTQHEQTAKLPANAAPTAPVAAPSANANGSVGTSVQH